MATSTPSLASDALTFDPKAHEYRWRGAVVPHVTGILRDAGLVDDTYYTAWSRERGSKVHKACHFLMEGDLAWETVDPRIVGYVRSLQTYVEQSGLVAVACEAKFFDESHGFAGTIDLVGKDRTGSVIVDYKTGVPDAAAALQTAMYQRGWFDAHGVMCRRLALHLQRDGSVAKAVPYADPGDWTVARAALTVLNWRKRNGRLT